MFSLTPSEMLTIAIVALIVFGPRRLPELARQAGRAVAYLRRATAEIKSEVEGELGDITTPLREATETFREAGSALSAEGKELRQTVEGELKWVDSPPTEDDPPAEDGPERGDTPIEDDGADPS